MARPTVDEFKEQFATGGSDAAIQRALDRSYDIVENYVPSSITLDIPARRTVYLTLNPPRNLTLPDGVKKVSQWVVRGGREDTELTYEPDLPDSVKTKAILFIAARELTADGLSEDVNLPEIKDILEELYDAAT